MSCSGYIQPSPKVIRIIDQEQDEVHLVNLDFLNLSLRGGGIESVQDESLCAPVQPRRRAVSRASLAEIEALFLCQDGLN